MTPFDERLADITSRLQRVVDERKREEAIPLLLKLMTVAPTPGGRVALMRCASLAMSGRVEAGGALVELGGPDFIRALAEAGAPPPVLRSAIEAALLERYKELPSFIAANGGRPAFTRWCRQAEFVVPASLPETVDIYRGSMGVSPHVAKLGLHWSLSFDDASYYAARFADEHLTGAVVLHARVPRDSIACIVSCTAHSELVPADVPAEFVVIIDHDRIADAAVRAMELRKAQIASGKWFVIAGSHGIGRRDALEARERMAAAGVAPGTALVL